MLGILTNTQHRQLLVVSAAPAYKITGGLLKPLLMALLTSDAGCCWGTAKKAFPAYAPASR